MKTFATSPLIDPARIAALRRSSLLDTPPEEQFDRLAQLTSTTLHAPSVLISLVDADREFFKSSIGLPAPWQLKREAPLSHSFCQHVVTSGKPLIIEDAHEHPWVRNNLAIGTMSIVAYAGMPLWSADGYVLGALCATHPEPHRWGASEVRMLEEFTAVAMHEIAARGTLPQNEGGERLLFGTPGFQNLIEHPLVGLFLAQDGRLRHVDPKFAAIFGYTQEEIVSTMGVLDLVGEEDLAWFEQKLRKCIRAPTDTLFFGFRGKRKDGARVDIEVHGTGTGVDGEPAVIGAMLRIDERAQADAALR
ncbi:MAG: GAF domain-containing protein, partial [Gemmatimonadota bacterium]|nr:GAF domain-containing protein [Gemmatimonadota bacterium]